MSFIRETIIGAAIMATTMAFTTAAVAHPKLVAASPAPNAVVSHTSTIQLRFSEKLVRQFSSVDLAMTGMPGMGSHNPMKLGGVTTTVGADGKTLMVKLRQPLSAGTYKLDWHAVSTDTHRISGAYSFQVK